eukprot:COSAG05_NODE_20691_length_277_cov_1.162921_1_plen_75_part_01
MHRLLCGQIVTSTMGGSPRGNQDNRRIRIQTQIPHGGQLPQFIVASLEYSLIPTQSTQILQQWYTPGMALRPTST